MDLHVQAGELRFRDPSTGEDLRTYDEAEDERAGSARKAAAEKANADAERANAAAERARANAAVERAKADAEKERDDAAERELERLRLRLQEP